MVSSFGMLGDLKPSTFMSSRYEQIRIQPFDEGGFSDSS